jgi:hypothetical protein
LARSPTSGRGNTATRESKAQTRAVPQFTCSFRCLAGCLFLNEKATRRLRTWVLQLWTR